MRRGNAAPLLWIALFILVVAVLVLWLTGGFSSLLEKGERWIERFSEYPPAEYEYIDEDSCRKVCKRGDYECQKVNYKWRCVKK